MIPYMMLEHIKILDERDDREEWFYTISETQELLESGMFYREGKTITADELVIRIPLFYLDEKNRYEMLTAAAYDSMIKAYED